MSKKLIKRFFRAIFIVIFVFLSYGIVEAITNQEFSNSNEVLSVTDSGEEVTKLNELLFILGYLKSEVRDYFNFFTRDAVGLFQRDSNLKEDFMVGIQTKKALVDAVSALNKSVDSGAQNQNSSNDSNTPAGNTDQGSTSYTDYLKSDTKIRLNDTGDTVSDLQKDLVSLGFDIKIDGSFGIGTENAVKTFQTSWSLTSDGIVGSSTKQALIKALNGEQPPEKTEEKKESCNTPWIKVDDIKIDTYTAKDDIEVKWTSCGVDKVAKVHVDLGVADPDVLDGNSMQFSKVLNTTNTGSATITLPSWAVAKSPSGKVYKYLFSVVGGEEVNATVIDSNIFTLRDVDPDCYVTIKSSDTYTYNNHKIRVGLTGSAGIYLTVDDEEKPLWVGETWTFASSGLTIKYREQVDLAAKLDLCADPNQYVYGEDKTIVTGSSTNYMVDQFKNACNGLTSGTVNVKVPSDGGAVVRETNKPAVLAWVHSNWAKLTGYKWIWNSYFVENPSSSTSYTFDTKFNVGGQKIIKASLQAAADDEFIASINGTFVGQAIRPTISANSPKTFSVPINLINDGLNTLSVEVKNVKPSSGGTAFTNPGAGAYQLSLDIDCRPDVVTVVEVPLSCDATKEIVSDTNAFIVETQKRAVLTAKHGTWTTKIPGAKWIWKSYQVERPDIDESYTFRTDFNISGLVGRASLEIAADDGFEVYINKKMIGSESVKNNTAKSGYKTYDIEKSLLKQGVNSLEVKVLNTGQGQGALAKFNPAGGLYRIILVGGCDTIETEIPPKEEEKTPVVDPVEPPKEEEKTPVVDPVDTPKACTEWVSARYPAERTKPGLSRTTYWEDTFITYGNPEYVKHWGTNEVQYRIVWWDNSLSPWYAFGVNDLNAKFNTTNGLQKHHYAFFQDHYYWLRVCVKR